MGQPARLHDADLMPGTLLRRNGGYYKILERDDFKILIQGCDEDGAIIRGTVAFHDDVDEILLYKTHALHKSAARDPYETSPDPYGPGETYTIETDVDEGIYAIDVPAIPALLAGIGVIALAGVIGFFIGRRAGR